MSGNYSVPGDMSHFSLGSSLSEPIGMAKSYKRFRKFSRRTRTRRGMRKGRSRFSKRRYVAKAAGNEHVVYVTKRYVHFEDVTNAVVDISSGINFALNGSGTAAPAAGGEITIGCGTAFQPWYQQYEHYKIARVKVDFMWDRVTTGNAYVTAGAQDTIDQCRWPFLYVNDDNSSSAETYQQMLERPNAKMVMTMGGTPASLSFVPKSTTVIGGVTTSMPVNAWLDTSQPGVVHYGVKYTEIKSQKQASPNAGMVIGNRIRVLTMTVAFRHLKSQSAA